MTKARPITDVEFRRVMDIASSTRYPTRNRLCLLLSARAGMRVGEIMGLDLGDVFDNDRAEVRDRIYLESSRVKWGHAREIHLNRSVQRAISGYLAHRGVASGPLILTQSETRYGRTGLVGLFKGLYARAGIDTSSHAGRALFITSLADKGISIRIIQKAVGHRSLAATNAYLDARPQEVAAAVGLLS